MKVLIGLARARKVLIHVHAILKASRAKQRTLRLEEVIHHTAPGKAFRCSVCNYSAFLFGLNENTTALTF